MAVVTGFSRKKSADDRTPATRRRSSATVRGAIFTAMPSVCMMHKWLICVWIAIIGFLVFGIIAGVLIADTLHERRGQGPGEASFPPDESSHEKDDTSNTTDPSIIPTDNKVTPKTVSTTKYSRLTTNRVSTKGASTITNVIIQSPSLVYSTIKPSSTQKLSTPKPSTSVWGRSTEELPHEDLVKEIVSIILIIVFGIGIIAVITVAILVKFCCPHGLGRGYKRIDGEREGSADQSISLTNYERKAPEVFTLPLTKSSVTVYTMSGKTLTGLDISKKSFSRTLLVVGDDVRPPSYEEAIQLPDKHHTSYFETSESPQRF